MLQVICSWCGIEITTVDCVEEGVSHGICKNCVKKHFGGMLNEDDLSRLHGRRATPRVTLAEPDWV